MEGDGAQLINLRASFLLVKPILWTYEVLIAKQRRTQWWSQVHYLNVDPFPSSYVKSTSCPPDIAHVISVPKAFPVFRCSSTSVCYTKHKLKSKMREGWEWGYTPHNHKHFYRL